MPQIAWLAGLLEAEGSFLMSGRTIAIVANMTDRNVGERVAQVLGGMVYDVPHNDPRRLPVWRAQINGPAAAGWMMTLYPLLGQRRRSQVRNALDRWRAMRYVRISPGVERSILEAWRCGGATKLGLARSFGVSRHTIYNVLERAHRDGLVMEHDAITPMEIAWLAGLVEGDGNIAFNGRSCTIRIKMGDRDVVDRAAQLLTGRVYPATVAAGRKPMWLTQTKGTTAIRWALTLYSWLGIRRRQQVRDSPAEWRKQGNGVISPPLAASILAYRRQRYRQAEIIRILGVSKSTIYRHTHQHVGHIRVTQRQEAARRIGDSAE